LSLFKKSGTKKAFRKAFHEETRRDYDNEKTIKKKVRVQVEQLKSTKDPSKAGFLLREKQHDTMTIKQNI